MQEAPNNCFGSKNSARVRLNNIHVCAILDVVDGGKAPSSDSIQFLSTEINNCNDAVYF